MKTIKLAIIGLGQIAQNFHLPILNRNPEVEIIAVCDLNKSKALIVADKYGIKVATDSVDELLSIEELEAVVICTPTDSHCNLALAAISAGKHIMMEKPIARNLQEAQLIADAAEKANIKVMIATNQRFRYDARMIKNYVQMKEVGNVFYIQCGWIQPVKGEHWRTMNDKAGGGVLLDLGYSLIDALLWIYDYQPVKAVQANLFHHLTKTVEDVAVVNIQFENGSIATMELSWSLFTAKSDFYFTVHGSKGSIKINPLQLFKGTGESFEPVPHKDALSKIAIHKKSFESEIKHFLLALKELGPVISTPREAIETMKVIASIYESSRKQKQIDFV